LITCLVVTTKLHNLFLGFLFVFHPSLERAASRFIFITCIVFAIKPHSLFIPSFLHSLLPDAERDFVFALLSARAGLSRQLSAAARVQRLILVSSNDNNNDGNGNGNGNSVDDGKGNGNGNGGGGGGGGGGAISNVTSSGRVVLDGGDGGIEVTATQAWQVSSITLTLNSDNLPCLAFSLLPNTHVVFLCFLTLTLSDGSINQL
jgi:hypothetical protein